MIGLNGPQQQRDIGCRHHDLGERLAHVADGSPTPGLSDGQCALLGSLRHVFVFDKILRRIARTLLYTWSLEWIGFEPHDHCLQHRPASVAHDIRRPFSENTTEKERSPHAPAKW